MKLFAFYLLDAISKNAYELYAHRFSSFVVPLFLESYPQVDEGTRGKMEEMLLTWRTGSPTRKELFGVSQQIAIERGIWGEGGTSNSVSHPSFVSLLSSSFLQSGFQRTSIHVRSEGACGAVKSLRYDNTESHCRLKSGIFNFPHILQIPLCPSVSASEAGVSQDELRQILTQLRNMVKISAPAPVPQPTLPPVHNLSSQPPFPPHFAQSGAANIISSTPMPNSPANVANVLSSLLKAGVLFTSGISACKETKDEGFDEYRSAILSENVGLNTLDLAK